jgi:hypothetical protein
VLEAPILDSSPETGGYGLSGCSVPVVVRDRLVRSLADRAHEAAGRVAVARGDAPGVQLGADPADRSMSERGKRPGGARRTRVGGFGAGAPSAVVAGTWRRTRSSRASSAAPGRAGKPSTGRRGPVSASLRLDGRRSPVNTGAPLPGMGAGTSCPTLAARADHRSMCSWRAGCGGSRTSGSEGDGEETTGRKAGTGASPSTLREQTLEPARQDSSFTEKQASHPTRHLVMRTQWWSAVRGGCGVGSGGGILRLLV